jgi:ferric-dicitrate binding protein FerR (iron transport regulator)/Mg-chelatase subunit ChlD/tetratricopeptide (TPR) repeat protein
MSPTTPSPECLAVREDLAAIVDGDPEAVRRHADHLASCDECRDARHAAAAAARLLGAAGADFVPPADLEARLAAALDAAPAATEAASSTTPTPKSTPKSTPAPTPTPAPRRVNRARAGWLVVAAAAAIMAAVLVGREGQRPQKPPVGNGTTGTVAQVARAATDGASGIEIRIAAGGPYAKAAAGATLHPGSSVRTDARTRARLTLADGSIVTLNHNTEVTLDPMTVRSVALRGGEVLCEITHVDGAPPANVGFPGGRVEVLGTRFLVATTPTGASVRVTSGTVQVHSGRAAGPVRAGEEAVVAAGSIQVAPALDLAGSVGWTELDEGRGPNDVGVAGLGELRARKPGETQEKERPLSLAVHKVSVRITGNVARTEIEEVFRNDGGDTLEGIYRFPLPADARIARLALEVDGRLEEGAFVEAGRAAGIWRGVIAKATPRPLQQVQEIVWVPGPWRDPALLEWKRGGRFELKIYPIPARGSRRVILAYTQTVAPQGDRRRYVYPLPHSADRSLTVGHFAADVRVAGADPKAPVRGYGYDLRTAADAGATSLHMEQAGFQPAGDLIVEYSLPGGGRELHYWTFRGDVAAAPAGPTTTGPKAARDDATVAAAQQQIAGDQRPFVVFALRPKLPPAGEGKAREYRLVVDSSQSMIGERWRRAEQLVTALVAQMDRRDRFTLLACDVGCRAFDAAPQGPSAQTARAAAAWMKSLRAAGASNLAAALAAAALPPRERDGQAVPREVHVVYVGDGLATVGPRRAAALADEAAEVSRRSGASITTVGIGGDADGQILAAVARAGGGHYLPYVPGERPAAAALQVLETTFGASLRDVTVEVPAGVVDVAPARLPSLRAGQETLVAARFSGEPSGEVVLRGRLGGEAFERRYPIKLEPSSASGNAFVPRLWAAAAIERLDLEGRGEDRARIVALSRAFGVLSRHTSLLVLESAAMFKAFGIDRTKPVLDVDGNDDVDMHESGDKVGLGQLGALGHGAGGGGAGFAAGGLGRGAMGGSLAHAATASRAAGDEKGEKKAKGRKMGADDPIEDLEEQRERGPRASAPAPTARPARIAMEPKAPEEPRAFDEYDPRRGRRTVVPMRRVWFQVGEVAQYANRGGEVRAVEAAEMALRQNPDSRDRHRALVQALARAGDVSGATAVAERWLARDPLDPAALAAYADLWARDGHRAEALRLLSGVVDLQPDDKAWHERLAAAYEALGDADHACAHRVALADIDPKSAATVGAAVRCERGRGRTAQAEGLLRALPDASLRPKAEDAARLAPTPSAGRGAVVVNATWDGARDLDVSLIGPKGERISWMGGAKGVVANAAASPGQETLTLGRATVGGYVVEVARTRPDDDTPTAGKLSIRALGATRTVPFTLTGTHAQVARIDIRRESRLEPVPGAPIMVPRR